VTVGGVLGGILGLALIIGAIVFLVRRRGKATKAVTSTRWDNPELDDNQVQFQEAETLERRNNLELDGNQVWVQEAPMPVLVELSGQLSRPELQS
jgi:hypothetical protein